MDRAVATLLLERELADVRRAGYRNLRSRVGSNVHKDVTGPDGKEYQLELVLAWDNKPDGAIRAIAAIDDGGLRSFWPLTADDVIAPDVEKQEFNP